MSAQCEVTAKLAADGADKSAMSVFERYLTVWVFLCIVVGIALGQFVPAPFQALGRMELAKVNLPVGLLIWVMIIPMLIKVDFGALAEMKKHVKGIGVTLVVNWLVKPFSMAFLGWLFIRNIFAPMLPADQIDSYIAGLILLAAAPCTAMVFVWSRLTKGDPLFTLSQVAVNDTIMIFAFAPIVGVLLGISAITVPWDTLVTSVALYIVIPLALAQLWRKALLKKGQAHFDATMEKIGPWSITALLATLVLLFAFQGKAIIEQPLIIALLAVPILIQVFFNSALAYWLNRAVGEKHNVACPSALIGASNFFELAVAAAISLFGFESGAALATVVGVLIEVPVMLLVVKVVNASKGWYEAGRALMDLIIAALQSGAASLASYLAAHVLLCLVPAFFIAGGLSALVPQQSIVRFLGPDAPRYIAYPAAAGAGSLLAVCSCTVQPLFAGIYSKGAGLGPAITFLFFAPAANILALSYTGVALGADFAIARIVLALCFGIGIGMLMALIFRRGDAARTAAHAAAFAGGEGISRRALIFLGTLVALLIAGTLKVDFLAATLFNTTLPWDGVASAQALLDRLVPVNEIKGEEGLSLQGLTLIGLLLAIGAAAWRGLGKVDEGFNRLSWLALGLTVATLVFAAIGIRATDTGLALTITGRSLAVAALCAALLPQARRFDAWDMQQWLWETWRFIRMIFPLLIVGVFLVGVIRSFIQPEWIQYVAGANTVLANLAGVVFGVFMYFPTLVEVPIAKMFLSLGMHPGPLIAYLMADPELSLQSILITSAIIGKLKAWTYVGLVAVFSTISGLTYGAWVDGTPLTTLALVIGGFILTLTLVVQVIERLQGNSKEAT